MTDPTKEEPVVLKSITETLTALPNKIFKREAASLIFLVLAVSGVAVWAQSRLDTKAGEKAKAVETKLDEHIVEQRRLNLGSDASISALSAKINAIEQRQIAKDERDAVKEERDAARYWMIYNATVSGNPQPGARALSKPAVQPDGGTR